MTISPEQEQAIRNKLAEMPELAVGLGDEKSACSVAAINLALTGELTDKIPGCMSEVIGQWIIVVQDEMPAEIRNSAEWRELLPLAAGTGREREEERAGIIKEWAWQSVSHVRHADNWRQMCKEQTIELIQSVLEDEIGGEYEFLALSIKRMTLLNSFNYATSVYIECMGISGQWYKFHPVTILKELLWKS